MKLSVVEQKIEPLAGGELAAGVLLLDAAGSPTLARLLAHLAQAVELVEGGHATDSFALRLVGPAGIEPATIRL